MARAPNESAEIKIRMREPLRAEIEKAAEDKGISMNAEMVERLEASFSAEDSLASAFALAYGDRVAGLALLIAQTFHDAGLHSSRKAVVGPSGQWIEDPYAYDQAVRGVMHILEAARPSAKIQQPKPSDIWHKDVASSQAAQWMIEDAGELVAREQIRFMNSEKGRHDRWINTIKKLLGPMASMMAKTAKQEGRKQ